ncbi:hypothetical protein AVEN_202384-1, partial [Araneus ventricosus]
TRINTRLRLINDTYSVGFGVQLAGWWFFLAIWPWLNVTLTAQNYLSAFTERDQNETKRHHTLWISLLTFSTVISSPFNLNLPRVLSAIMRLRSVT